MVFTTSRLMQQSLPVLLLLASTAMVMVVRADERKGSIPQRSSSSLSYRRIISQRNNNDGAINDDGRRSSSSISGSSPHLFVVEGNITCDLYLKDIEYETTIEEQCWVCELSQEDTLRIGNDNGSYGSMIRYVDIIVESHSDTDADSDRLLLPASSSTSSFISAISGVSSMTIPGGNSEATGTIIDIDEDKMYIPHDAIIEIRNYHPNTATATTKATSTRDRHRHHRPNHRRGLAAKEGILRTVVIRVTDSEGISPQASREQLIQDFYSIFMCSLVHWELKLVETILSF